MIVMHIVKTPMRASATCFALAALAIATLSSHAIAATDSIGTATSIATSVTGTIETKLATLKTGDDVFQNETIVTDANGVGQFRFNDQTKLAIGPGSTVVLDNFVYDSNTSQGKVVINLTAGALRFITGKADHNAYEIVTPTATIESTPTPVVPSNTRHSISAQYDFGGHYTVRAGIINLTDEEPSFPTRNYGDIIGRQYYVGLRARF